MKLSVGIVGLPNVGKSSLFNALLKKQIADASNYPFCTIDPNVGVIEVPDDRLNVLAKIVNTQKIIPAAIEFYDIAGLVKGASKGEGLGNKFLAHIREVSVIVHVVRTFVDENIIHVANKIDPKDDITVIDTELALADMGTLAKQPDPRFNASKEEKARWEVIVKVKKDLDNGIPLRKQNLSEDEIELLKPLNLLTLKKIIYVFNSSESDLKNYKDVDEKCRQILKEAKDDSEYVLLSIKLENEILSLSAEEQIEYLKELNISETGLNRLVKKCYSTLGLISFLTAGEKEARAWTIAKGTKAPQAAAVIHTDFEKHFIKAEILSYDNFVKYSGWVKAREDGKVSIVGKDYVVNEGDIVDFKIGT